MGRRNGWSGIGRRGAIGWGFTGLMAAALLSGCDSGTSYQDLSLVGEVSSVDAFVAIVADDDKVVVYVCDGKEDAVSTSAWFAGPHEDGAFDLTNPGGFRVTGDLNEESGVFTPPEGADVAFDVSAQGGDTGLYVFEEVVEDGDLRGGWIVTQNGQRGAVINRTTGDLVAGPQVTPSAPSVEVFGQSFEVYRLVVPWDG